VARTGPIVIGYDDTSASRPAIDETVALFKRRKALFVVVWEAGRALELLEPPADILALPPTTIEARAAVELDQAMYRSAEQTRA
jgi:nucleotide-binding universal stress UspA family protein